MLYYANRKLVKYLHKYMHKIFAFELSLIMSQIVNTEMSVFNDQCHCFKLILPVPPENIDPWAIGTRKKRTLFRLFIFIIL